jgi:hypothetical protein
MHTLSIVVNILKDCDKTMVWEPRPHLGCFLKSNQIPKRDMIKNDDEPFLIIQ